MALSLFQAFEASFSISHKKRNRIVTDIFNLMKNLARCTHNNKGCRILYSRANITPQ